MNEVVAATYNWPWSEILVNAISIISIVATARISIVAIRKTAEEQRVSVVHEEMTDTLVGIVRIIGRLIDLLDSVTRRVVYSDKETHAPIESAYARYRRELDNLSGRYQKYRWRARLFMPGSLTSQLETLVKELNEANDLSIFVKPDEHNVYPDTSGLLIKVGEIAGQYRLFVNDCRAHIGTERLGRLTTLQLSSLESETGS